MQCCVDSGLWVTDAKSAGLTPASETLQKELDAEQEAEEKEEEEEEVAPSPGTPEDDKEESGEHYEEVD